MSLWVYPRAWEPAPPMLHPRHGGLYFGRNGMKLYALDAVDKCAAEKSIEVLDLDKEEEGWAETGAELAVTVFRLVVISQRLIRKELDQF